MFNLNNWEKNPLILKWNHDGTPLYNPNYRDNSFINKQTGLVKTKVTFTLEQQDLLDKKFSFREFLISLGGE